MVRQDDEGAPERNAAQMEAGVLKTGWEQTVADMRAMANDREERGYEAITLTSFNTAPIAPADGPDDDKRWGLSHLPDSDDVETFKKVYPERDFSETGVYQFADAGNVFMVTEHIDFDNELIIYIAGAFRMLDAAAMVRAAMDRGKLYSYVRELDGTVVGSFEHDDPGAFFPDPEAYYAYEQSR